MCGMLNLGDVQFYLRLIKINELNVYINFLINNYFFNINNTLEIPSHFVFPH